MQCGKKSIKSKAIETGAKHHIASGAGVCMYRECMCVLLTFKRKRLFPTLYFYVRCVATKVLLLVFIEKTI